MEFKKEEIMSISYNKSILVGRLTADPELSFSQGGMQISKLTLAVDRQYQKDKVQEADFLRIVSFGKLAEFTRDYLKKGILIMVEGRIQTGKYQNKEGITIYTTDIMAERINFMETKKSRAENPTNAEKPMSDSEFPDNLPVADGGEVPF